MQTQCPICKALTGPMMWALVTDWPQLRQCGVAWIVRRTEAGKVGEQLGRLRQTAFHAH